MADNGGDELNLASSLFFFLSCEKAERGMVYLPFSRDVWNCGFTCIYVQRPDPLRILENKKQAVPQELILSLQISLLYLNMRDMCLVKYDDEVRLKQKKGTQVSWKSLIYHVVY